MRNPNNFRKKTRKTIRSSRFLVHSGAAWDSCILGTNPAGNKVLSGVSGDFYRADDEGNAERLSRGK